MAILPIRTFPDPILRRSCERADPGSEELRKLASDMIETMYNAPGIGLAAPQVGVSVRLITVDVTAPLGQPDPHVLLNPEILSAEGTISFEEGCLSLPELTVLVDRADVVRVRYQDLEGCDREVLAQDLLAVAIQHEMDHLEGKLIYDYASAVRRDVYRRRAKKMKEEKPDFSQGKT